MGLIGYGIWVKSEIMYGTLHKHTPQKFRWSTLSAGGGGGVFRSQLPMYNELLLVQLYGFIVSFIPVKIVVTLAMFSDSWLRHNSSLGETVCHSMSCRRF